MIDAVTDAARVQQLVDVHRGRGIDDQRARELAVLAAALEWVRTGNMDPETQAVMYARDDLRLVTVAWFKGITDD